MTLTTCWHFHGHDPVVVSRVPALPRSLIQPVNSLFAELTATRQGMEDFLETWRDHKRKREPRQLLVGSHCAIRIAGQVARVYPLRGERWRDASEAWLPLVSVEEMFAAYAAWAFGGASAPRVGARQGGSA